MSEVSGDTLSGSGLSPTVEPVPVSPLRASIPIAGDLRVWWIPQVPMKAFEVDVPDLLAAGILIDALGKYDAFQFAMHVKPDYCNAGGLVILREDGEWEDWESPDFDDFDTWWDANHERLFASAIEARRAETGTGSVHDGAVAASETPDLQP
jgi:hypothetical protein